VIQNVHEIGGWLVIFTNAAVGVWALLAHNIERLRGRAVWVAVVIAQALIVVQVLAGLVMQAEVGNLGGQHQLYGFATFVSVGAIYVYRNEMRDRPYLLYGLGSLWLMGLGIRAIFLVL